MMRFFISYLCIFLLSCSLVHAQQAVSTLSQALFDRYGDLYQPPKAIDNNSNSDLIALGKKIFFDQRFSKNGQMACGTCHLPKKAFSDHHAKALGNQGNPLKRKTMTLYHIANDTQFFWDGRAKTLEAQFAEALENPLEMDFSFERAIHLMQKDKQYQALLPNNIIKKADYKALIISATVTYIKAITPPKTNFDAWLSGDLNALTAQQLKGFELFNAKANCTACHMGHTFKDGILNDIGLPDTDLGYGALTHNSDDFHMFKTPSLRGIADRAPYMHDGSLATLKAVIDHYNAPIFKRGDTDIPEPEAQGDIIAFHNFTQPLNLTEQEIDDLIAFLKIL